MSEDALSDMGQPEFPEEHMGSERRNSPSKRRRLRGKASEPDVDPSLAAARKTSVDSSQISELGAGESQSPYVEPTPDALQEVPQIQSHSKELLEVVGDVLDGQEKIAVAEKSGSPLDRAYDLLANITFPRPEISKLLDKDFLAWIERLQGGLQVNWPTVLLMLLSQTSFQLHRVVAQYTRMLGVPPLPWLGIMGRPGSYKSVAIWFAKQVVMELQQRSAPRGEVVPEGDAGDEDGEQAKKQRRAARWLVDLGTLYGFLQQASQNEDCAYALLHEGKTFLAKVVAEAPGFDPQALNKLFDRDEVSNSVMTATSRFQMDRPWVVFFMALHLEELKHIFGGAAGKDSCAIFARFDFFHQASLMPDLGDYNDYGDDEAITFVADIMQLVQAAYPKLEAAQLEGIAEDTRKHYSLRTAMWKVPQDNAFFTESFQKHSTAQRDATNAKDHNMASHHSKTKTKECRYSVPVDALMKGFRQKRLLEKYRSSVMETAAKEGNPDIAQAVKDMCIMALRQRAIDKNPELLESLALPFWKREVTCAAAEVGHLVTRFLGQQSEVVRGYVFDKTLKDNASVAGMSPNSLTTEIHSATPLLQGDGLVIAAKKVDRDAIVRAVQTILHIPMKAKKLAQVKGLPQGPTLSVAVSLLHDLGVVQRIAWKRKGASGYPSTFVFKNINYKTPLAELKVANLLRDVFKVDIQAFKSQQEDEVSKELVAGDCLGQMPAIDATAVDLFKEVWTPLLQAPAQSSTADCAPDNSANTPMDPNGVNRIAAHFRWICGRTSQLEIKKSYIQNRIPGFSGVGDDWDVLTTTMRALGLAKEVKRGASAGVFQILRPSETDKIPEVVELLSTVFGPLDNKEVQTLTNKLKEATPNNDFHMESFQQTIEDLRNSKKKGLDVVV